MPGIRFEIGRCQAVDQGEGMDFDHANMEEEVVTIDTKKKSVKCLAILLCVFVKYIAPKVI